MLQIAFYLPEMFKNFPIAPIALVSVSGFSLLGVSPLALAGYVPPSDQKPPSDYSRSTGTRNGCVSAENQVPLVLLAPQNHEGRTRSTRPVFAWFSADSYPTDFRLFEFTPEGKVRQRGETITLSGARGLVTLSLPADREALTVGRKYLWQVAIRCPNGNYILQRAEILVVEPPVATKENATAGERIETHARSGYWYDAFAGALELAADGRLGEAGAALALDLAGADIPDGFDRLPEAEQRTVLERLRALQQFARSDR